MGNKLLILVVAASVICGFAFAQSDPELQKIDTLIEKIKIKRVGISNDEIKKLKDPFYYDKEFRTERLKKIRKRGRYYRLYAVFNDKAKINGKWYKKGSKIGPYRLAKICGNCVKLVSPKRVLTLYIPKKSKKIKIIGK